MLGLMLVLSVTSLANDTLSALHHDLISLWVHRSQVIVNATMRSIASETIRNEKQRLV